MPAPLSIPCEQVIRGCDCTNDPISNYSSEAPDHEVFYGQVTQPPTVGTWFAPACFGVCESLVSQELADECAARNAFECSLDGAPRTGNPTPNGSFPPLRFRSSVQECSADCGDGNTTTVVEPAGTVVSSTQADADARAHGLACKRVQELKVCFVTTSPLPSVQANTFASIPIIATGGNGDYEFTLASGTLPVGMTLDPVGLIFGTPTGSGTSTFAITVADTGGGTSTKTFTLDVTSVCGVTDWCTGPGADPCRLRIKDFNSADWQSVCTGGYFATWDGTFSFATTIGGNPCTLYVAPLPGVVFLPPSGVYLIWDGTEWVFHAQLPAPATGLVAVSNGPAVQASPIGVFTPSGPTCTGPASFEIESYVP